MKLTWFDLEDESEGFFRIFAGPGYHTASMQRDGARVFEVMNAIIGENKPVLSPWAERDETGDATDEPTRQDGILAVERWVVDVMRHGGGGRCTWM